MSMFSKNWIVAGFAGTALFFGAAQDVRAGVIESRSTMNCRDLPVVKNLTGLKLRHVCEGMTPFKSLTRRDAAKLAAAAKAPEDHLAVAHFYEVEANRLERQAAAYQQAAVGVRSGPFVKNLIAPSTAARLDFAADGYHQEAQADRALAASHEEMARRAVASLR